MSIGKIMQYINSDLEKLLNEQISDLITKQKIGIVHKSLYKQQESTSIEHYYTVPDYCDFVIVLETGTYAEKNAGFKIYKNGSIFLQVDASDAPQNRNIVSLSFHWNSRRMLYWLQSAKDLEGEQVATLFLFPGDVITMQSTFGGSSKYTRVGINLIEVTLI